MNSLGINSELAKATKERNSNSVRLIKNLAVLIVNYDAEEKDLPKVKKMSEQ